MVGKVKLGRGSLAAWGKGKGKEQYGAPSSRLPAVPQEPVDEWKIDVEHVREVLIAMHYATAALRLYCARMGVLRDDGAIGEGVNVDEHVAMEVVEQVAQRVVYVTELAMLL